MNANEKSLSVKGPSLPSRSVSSRNSKPIHRLLLYKKERGVVNIAITDNHRPKLYFDNYINWIHRVNPNVELVKLSYHLKNEHLIHKADGLILTGGGDVHPKFYGNPNAIDQTEEVNELRDEFELNVIEDALGREIPILGICRGMQIINVALGGTLIPDLLSLGFNDHAQRNSQENRHAVTVVPHTMLDVVTGKSEQTVNSVHHQAIDQLGRGLMVSAVSPDGVIEAAEWALKDRMPFLLLVQWHPERMKDFDNPYVRNIAEYFLHEVRQSIDA